MLLGSASNFWCSSQDPVSNGCGTTNYDVDPGVAYDSVNGRWITSAVAWSNTCSSAVWTWLAVSRTSDPNPDPTKLYLYAFKACGDNSSDWGDQPMLGMDNKWIVVHDDCYTQPPANEQCPNGGVPVTTDYNLHAFDKSALYAGQQLQKGTNYFNMVDPYVLDVPAVTYASSATSAALLKF